MEKVIIAITTYNLEKYVSQAIDSVLSQKTSFKYRILVADDCSTDNTPIILKDYEERYPDVINVLYSDKNLGSLANSNRLFDRIDSEYFSFLDGDDYWVDNNRLQKQVDFLDNHKQYSMCGGNTQFLRNGNLDTLMLGIQDLNKEYNFEDEITRKLPLIHTSSILLRNTIYKNGLPKCFKNAVGTFEECAVRGENFRRMLHLKESPLYLMEDTFSVYRIHDAGMWQGASPVRRAIESAIAYNFYSKYFDFGNNLQLNKMAKKSYENMMIWLLSNKYLLHPNKLSEKELFLLTSLMKDVSSEENVFSKTSKVKIYILKFFTELLHVL